MEYLVQQAALVLGQVLPAAQQQPLFPFDDIAHLPPFAEELCPPHFVHRVVGVLDDVELVVYDAALRSPLLNTDPERLPHVHTGRLDALALPSAELGSEVFVQRPLLPLLAKPERLASFQITHYRQKLILLPPVDFVHSHLFQRWLATPLVPSFQVAQIDCAHRSLRQVKMPRHLTGGGTLAGFPHDLLESLAERRLGRQLLDLFHADPAVGASQAMHFHHHSRPVYAPWQVSNLPLPHIVNTMQAATAATTFKPPVNGLAPHPQLQGLPLFVQCVPIYPVPRPRQNRRPFF